MRNFYYCHFLSVLSYLLSVTRCTYARHNLIAQVYQEITGAYKSLDKYYGRTLTDDTFCDVLREFLHNGREMRSELLAAIVSRLTALLTCLKGLSSFRFYASSLLIIYDGCSPSPRCSEQNTGGEQNSAGSARRDSGGKRGESENQSGRMFPGSPEHPAAVKSEQFVVVPSECVGQEMLSGSMGAAPVCSRHLSLSTSALTDSATRCSMAASCQSSNNGNVVSKSLDLVDVRMIDFAHTTHSGFHEDEVVHEGPDHDYMWGLQNLIDLFSQLQGEKTWFAPPPCCELRPSFLRPLWLALVFIVTVENNSYELKCAYHCNGYNYKVVLWQILV